MSVSDSDNMEDNVDFSDLYDNLTYNLNRANRASASNKTLLNKTITRNEKNNLKTINTTKRNVQIAWLQQGDEDY